MPSASKKKKDIAADIVAAAISEAPTVNEGVVASIAAEKSETAAPPESGGTVGAPAADSSGRIPVRDSKGSLFDPAKHAKKKDGAPSFNADGSFRARRGIGLNTTPGPIDPEDTTNIVACRKFAQWSADMFFGTTEKIFGPHWKPEPDEAKRIGDDTERAFIAWGIVDLPPGICLCLSIALYAAPRAADPRTRARIEEMLGAVRGKKPTDETLFDAKGNGAGE